MIINLSYDNYTLSNVKAFVTYVDFLNWRKLKMMLYGVMFLTGTAGSDTSYLYKIQSVKKQSYYMGNNCGKSLAKGNIEVTE